MYCLSLSLLEFAIFPQECKIKLGGVQAATCACRATMSVILNAWAHI